MIFERPFEQNIHLKLKYCDSAAILVKFAQKLKLKGANEEGWIFPDKQSISCLKMIFATQYLQATNQ